MTPRELKWILAEEFRENPRFSPIFGNGFSHIFGENLFFIAYFTSICATCSVSKIKQLWVDILLFFFQSPTRQVTSPHVLIHQKKKKKFTRIYSDSRRPSRARIDSRRISRPAGEYTTWATVALQRFFHTQYQPVPSQAMAGTIYTPGWREAIKSKVSCSRTQVSWPGLKPPELEFDALNSLITLSKNLSKTPAVKSILLNMFSLFC